MIKTGNTYIIIPGINENIIIPEGYLFAEVEVVMKQSDYTVLVEVDDLMFIIDENRLMEPSDFKIEKFLHIKTVRTHINKFDDKYLP